MFAGFTETFLNNGGQLLLYQYTKKEREITQISTEVLVYLILGIKSSKNYCKEINSNCRGPTIRRAERI